MDAASLLKKFCSAVERVTARPSPSCSRRMALYLTSSTRLQGPHEDRRDVDDWFHRTARDFRWEMFRP